MQKHPIRNQILIGITLFSMFFGAGNLIFPVFLGASAGGSALPAFFGFALSAVGLPILGVIAVARSGGLYTLAGRAGKRFSLVFILLIYLAIGPCLAIPRTASTSFEMAVAPFVQAQASLTVLRVLYSLVFFGVALFLALRPSKLVEWLGKRLAPVLLTLIVVLFLGCLISGMTGTQTVAQAYTKAPAVQGFLDGYQTMDAIAALIFGAVLTLNIQARGITEERSVISTTVRAGGIAAALFAAIYGMLVYMGWAGGIAAENGAQLLSSVAQRLFGQAGGILLAAIFIIACLDTCIGLLCCCAEYFHKLMPRLSYRVWVCVFAAVSALIANAGLDLILQLSVPVLNCLYPVAIVLILLSFLPVDAATHPLLYPLPSALAGVFGVVSALDGLGFQIPGVTAWFSRFLPLYSVGLGWLLPVAAGIAAGLLVKRPR